MYYVDLTLREEDSLTDAVRTAQQEAERYRQAGVDTASLEKVAWHLLKNGQFEDGEEEVPLLLEEFYPEMESDTASKSGDKPQPQELVRATRLTNKLGTVQ